MTRMQGREDKEEKVMMVFFGWVRNLIKPSKYIGTSFLNSVRNYVLFFGRLYVNLRFSLTL
jgi:hypothetical protein